MKDILHKSRIIFILFFAVFFTALPVPLLAQDECNAWRISISDMIPSSCFANGQFTIDVSGLAVANLSDFRYSIVNSNTGYVVSARASNIFTNVPNGEYTVLVEAVCNNNILIHKTHTFTASGAYRILSINDLTSAKAYCGNNGSIRVLINESLMPPYKLLILSAPGTYTGVREMTFSGSGTGIGNLPVGTYQLQVEDNCGSRTQVVSATVGELYESAFDLNNVSLHTNSMSTCDSFRLMPHVAGNNEWQSRLGSLQFRYSLDSGRTYSQLGNGYFGLPNGKRLKDLRNTDIYYQCVMSCGRVIDGVLPVGDMRLRHSYKGNQCNGVTSMDFTITDPVVCRPFRFYFLNSNNDTVYQTTDNTSFTLPVLQDGTYHYIYETNDGYRKTEPYIISNSNPGGYVPNNYSLEIGLDPALHQYFNYFNLVNGNGYFPDSTSIELISAPPHYSFSKVISYMEHYSSHIIVNQAVDNGTNKFFVPGIYKFLIKNRCDSLVITKTVNPRDLYYFRYTGLDTIRNCSGRYVKPGVEVSINNTSSGTYYGHLTGEHGNVLPNNAITLTNGNLKLYAVPDSALLGFYAANVTAPNGLETIPLQYRFILKVKQEEYKLLELDKERLTGYICSGINDSVAKININARYGFPWSVPNRHYRYSLARENQGNTGPYISVQDTGYFENFGGRYGETYEVKVEDSCGASFVQKIVITDLSVMRTAYAQSSVICEGDTLSLIAVPVPGAVYSWIGPNGFTSSGRTPVIPNAAIQHSGTYTLTITSNNLCADIRPFSFDVVVLNAPDASVITVECYTDSAVLIASPVPGIDYAWYEIYYRNNAAPRFYAMGVDIPRLMVDYGGYFAVATVNPVSGCKTFSTPVALVDFPDPPLQVHISPPYPALCGANTMLYAGTNADSRWDAASMRYQWLFNNQPIPGATNKTYYASQVGTYAVSVFRSACNTAVSPPVNLEPFVTDARLVALSDTIFCRGDSVVLQTTFFPHHEYIWFNNDTIVDYSYNTSSIVRTAGNYRVIVKNGSCTDTTNAIQVIVKDRPAVRVVPGGDINICPPQTDVQLDATVSNASSYHWYYNGQVLAANVHTITARQTGSYFIIAENEVCKNDTSELANVRFLPPVDTSFWASGPVEFCMGGNVVLNVKDSAMYSYAWKHNSVWLEHDEASLLVQESGSYKVFINDGNCSDSTAVINVIVHPMPKPLIERMDLTLSTQEYTAYQWVHNGKVIAGAISRNHEISETGYYQVEVSGDFGCMGLSDSFFVASLTEPCILRIPNAFTPNNDGKNDEFRLAGDKNYIIEQFIIVNRWGQVVFSTKDINKGWDGAFKGQPMEIGTYFYTLRYKCTNGGKDVFKKGDLQLLR